MGAVTDKSLEFLDALLKIFHEAKLDAKRPQYLIDLALGIVQSSESIATAYSLKLINGSYLTRKVRKTTKLVNNRQMTNLSARIFRYTRVDSRTEGRIGSASLSTDVKIKSLTSSKWKDIYNSGIG